MKAGAFAKEAIHEAEDEEQGRAPRVLLFIDMGTWDDGPPPERPWGVRDRIPLRQPRVTHGIVVALRPRHRDCSKTL